MTDFSAALWGQRKPVALIVPSHLIQCNLAETRSRNQFLDDPESGLLSGRSVDSASRLIWTKREPTRTCALRVHGRLRRLIDRFAMVQRVVNESDLRRTTWMPGPRGARHSHRT
jgi:hypothetical protein